MMDKRELLEMKGQLAVLRDEHARLQIEASGHKGMIRRYLSPLEDDAAKLYLDEAQVSMSCLRKAVSRLQELNAKISKLEELLNVLKGDL
jgi:hypothetical protein